MFHGSRKGSIDEPWDVEGKGLGSAIERLSWIDSDSWWGSLWLVRREEFSKRLSRISIPSSEVLFANTPPAMASRRRASPMSKLK
jgi:hypothetical protein